MHQTPTLVIIGLVVVFALYRRARRTIGFQKLSRRRLLFRLVLFAFVGALLLTLGASTPTGLALDGLGLACGGGLAYLATRTTTFERRGESWFYRPNVWIGTLVFLLFIGRLASRAVTESALFRSGALSTSPAGQAPPSFSYTGDPVTGALIMVFVVYNMAYAVFLMRKAPHLHAPAGQAP